MGLAKAAPPRFKPERKRSCYGFFSALASFASTLVAVMVYVIVTFVPTFTSPFILVFESRAISQRSFPFCTIVTELNAWAQPLAGRFLDRRVSLPVTSANQ